MESTEGEILLSGQAKVWQLMFAFTDSVAFACAVELGIADIINSHGGPITLSQIASGIETSSSVDVACLERIMRFLVSKGIFAAANNQGGETVYSLNQDYSRWLLRDSELSLAPLILMENCRWLATPWHYLSQCVKEGGTAFKKAHGCEFWDFLSQNPEFNRIFNEGLGCTARVVMWAFLSQYKEGFNDVETLVDVGGGTGGHIGEIVKAYPHIKGINFDLPHVVATAPAYDGVCHVGGDMFESIPNADAIFMKWILHDWGDDDCVMILKNCRKAIPENGKVILVEIILQTVDGDDALFGNMGLVLDLFMLASTTGGKERTELEWKKLLEAGGFLRYKIIKIPTLLSIIEAYPQ